MKPAKTKGVLTEEEYEREIGNSADNTPPGPGEIALTKLLAHDAALRAALKREEKAEEKAANLYTAAEAALKKAEEENERLLDLLWGAERHEYVTEVKRVEEDRDEWKTRAVTLGKALRNLYGLIDSGWLVRDVSHDHEDGWGLKQLRPVMILKEVAALVGAAAALEEKP
jgi:hypothetical protein